MSNGERQYKASEDFLKRAEARIPLGSQTFSKSRTQYPVGASPLFLKRGKGSRVWDLDDNEYVDFVSALAAITLGYAHPVVTAAVADQLPDGVILSLPHPLEIEVAERLCAMVPCAEKVRFAKNGSDATAGAVRLARAWTGRDHVIVCGYHGWQDWYIGSTARHQGVPQAVRDLTHAVPYNDLEAVERQFASNPNAIAAIILEPMNVAYPKPGYLQGLKEIAHAHGALLIFDETITGFRFANGGAQEFFGVTPDLSCFGKGLGNGFPIAAVTGRADVMTLMEEIFFSFTFGGETLSLAAAKATLGILAEEPVMRHLADRGQEILDGLSALIEAERIGDVFGTCGHPSWSFLTITGTDSAPMMTIKTYVMQELHQAGFLSVGSHNVSYAHTSDDTAALCRAYERILPVAAKAARDGSLTQLLRVAPLVPLFRVR